MAECDSESAERFKRELTLAIGGATLYIFVSKISLLVNHLHEKSWYTDLMAFLVALSLGTMYCITLAQFIPEAFGGSIVSFFQSSGSGIHAPLGASLCDISGRYHRLDRIHFRSL